MSVTVTRHLFEIRSRKIYSKFLSSKFRIRDYASLYLFQRVVNEINFFQVLNSMKMIAIEPLFSLIYELSFDRLNKLHPCNLYKMESNCSKDQDDLLFCICLFLHLLNQAHQVRNIMEYENIALDERNI